MAEQERLEAIRIKLSNQIGQKETELKALRDKLKIIDGALGLLFEDSESKGSTKVVEIRKDKYKNLGLSDAIRDCINAYGATRVLSAAATKKLLLDNGIQTKSKHFYATVFGTLKRLADNGEIERVKGKGFKRKEADQAQRSMSV